MSLAGAKNLLQQIKDTGAPGILVAFSAGKDSWAVLDLCASVFDRVEAFFLYTVPGLSCEEGQIGRAERRYGIQIPRLPNPVLSQYLRAGYLNRHAYALRRILRWSDIQSIMRDRSGLEWIAFGQRMDESLQRRGMIKSSGGIMHKHKKVYPLWDWNAKSVFSYLRSRKIEFPENYGQWDCSGSGIGPEFLAFMKERYPDDYRKICRYFPHSETILERERVRGQAPVRHRKKTKGATN